MNILASKRLLTTGFVVLVVLNLVLLATLFWQQRCTTKSSPQPYGRHHAEFLRSLRLDPQQQQLFRQKRLDHYRMVQPDMEAIASLKKELIAESLKENPDSAAIRRLAERIGQHHANIEQQLATHFNQLWQNCTPTQQDSLKAFLERIAVHKYAMKMRRMMLQQ